MAASIKTETETVIKKILPYLMRREYDIATDLDFETAVQQTDRVSKGYVDILVTCGKDKPYFLIEAKKSSKKLSEKDRDQALSYGQALKLGFVVVTNGSDIECYNVQNKQLIRWNGKLAQKIPTKSQLPKVINTLKANKDEVNIALTNDQSLPFRPGLPLKQLNALFARCHNQIRKIEKDEDYAFGDFSKLLFLKLLEEKADNEPDFELPYSYRFHELAEKPEAESDQVSAAIKDMVNKIREKTQYGDVLEDALRLKNPRTFRNIVRELAKISFQDSSLDSKGAAFEYFVRATLKGKKLGQYFTPRPLIEFMIHLVGQDKILSAVSADTPIKVLDPACGTGGFLVFMMQQNLATLNERFKTRKITQKTYDNLTKKIKHDVFFGSDANPGVACAAKMNMIIAGDGHTNIIAADSLSKVAPHWHIDRPDCDIILTNPPFGTSESSSLTARDLSDYPFRRTKGQLLFLQKMVLSTAPNGDICTVIDEGVLNTDTAKELRRWLLKTCRIVAVVRLPEDTFKPNKINVRASVLYLQRREHEDVDFEDNYKITFGDLESLGYNGAGEVIRGFDSQKMISEISSTFLDKSQGYQRSGYKWSVFDIEAPNIIADETCRLDYKYWHPEILQAISALKNSGGKSIKNLNLIKTRRGQSPPAELYVDEPDGYALVVKAGTNISRYGELLTEGDYIEKNIYDEMKDAHIQEGDILLSSTGDGTLGKCCVYRSTKPAIADGHVTIIRVNKAEIDPDYLCDYLRIGFGARQIERLYTGSTGLVELTAKHVDAIIINLLSDKTEQQKVSSDLRAAETAYQKIFNEALATLENAKQQFSAL